MRINKHFKNIRGTSQEMGFGTKITNQSDRMLNKDGSFNVKRKGLRPLQKISVYHFMVTGRCLRGYWTMLLGLLTEDDLSY